MIFSDLVDFADTASMPIAIREEVSFTCVNVMFPCYASKEMYYVCEEFNAKQMASMSDCAEFAEEVYVLELLLLYFFIINCPISNFHTPIYLQFCNKVFELCFSMFSV